MLEFISYIFIGHMYFDLIDKYQKSHEILYWLGGNFILIIGAAQYYMNRQFDPYDYRQKLKKEGKLVENLLP